MPKGKVTESESTEELLESNSEGQSLTARQKEILSLVAQGFTNREIGEKLDISVRTVEVHRFNLMRRLRVRNVAQLLRQAIALRIIPQGPATPTTKT
ncbi:response regulator transcription factor [Candidatus Nitrospira allomarina]|uniref:LuxR C-terminal-related transcriptional regulator n=1 Tax=Candidatus Nitrospira allomarina TaxID=3020900 RepID=A0AA96K0F8_9BACT|nr:LuxR C-terminal-related transcriptional regulator [Candidatus Nitrospira allomarina]WNM59624.1 LuxR C-terminal-related transcriptional regulator [Candidatus Nitrospira allomarina]